jgi:hypothetical protein
MLNKIWTSPEILASKVDHVAARKEIQFHKFYKFWLWRQVPENWQFTRGFMLWFFLSWGMDYRIKSEKAKCGSFNRPTSPYFPLCVGDPPSIKTRVFKKICWAFSEISAHSGHFLTFSRTRSIWTNSSGILYKLLNHSDWKKTKKHFDQIVSTTMGQSYRFFYQNFFLIFSLFPTTFSSVFAIRYAHEKDLTIYFNAWRVLKHPIEERHISWLALWYFWPEYTPWIFIFL